MSWTLTSSSAAMLKAGNNYNKSQVSGALLTKLSDDCEATLSTLTRKDWVADYSSVSTNFKGVLSDTVSSMIALRMINFDMSAFSSRLEAATMLDVLTDQVNSNIAVLRDEKFKEVME